MMVNEQRGEVQTIRKTLQHEVMKAEPLAICTSRKTLKPSQWLVAGVAYPHRQIHDRPIACDRPIVVAVVNFTELKG